METSTQPHRQMLRRICTLGRVVGWAMTVVGALGVFSTVVTGWIMLARIGTQAILVAGAESIGQLLTGLVILGMVRFIRYVIDEDGEPGWLLRNGHIILGLLAVSLVVTIALHSWPQGWNNLVTIFGSAPEQTIPWDRRLGAAMITFSVLLPALAKVLCVLGLAAILRTVLPIMAESKTLA